MFHPPQHFCGFQQRVLTGFGCGAVCRAAAGGEVKPGAAFLPDSDPAVGGFADDDKVGPVHVER